MMIVQSLSSRFFFFPGPSHLAMSAPLTQSGQLKKMVIAARFNASVQDGCWPKLQIIREFKNSGISSVILYEITDSEPKPTGYLNFYEYDLTETNFDIQVGDRLNISWYGDIMQPDQIRFSLAYYDNGTFPGIPMVSIVVGDCNQSETDLLILDDLYCEQIDEPTTGSIITTSSKPVDPGTNEVTSGNSDQVTTISKPNACDTTSTTARLSTTSRMVTVTSESINQTSKNSNQTVIISGVMSLTLLLLIILLIFVVVCIMIKQKRKSASVNIHYVDQPQVLHITPSKTILCCCCFFSMYSPGSSKGGLASENDYIMDDRAPSAHGIQTDAMAHDSSNQQQDVRLNAHSSQACTSGLVHIHNHDAWFMSLSVYNMMYVI